jgi:hypothetical protein
MSPSMAHHLTNKNEDRRTKSEKLILDAVFRRPTSSSHQETYPLAPKLAHAEPVVGIIFATKGYSICENF